MENSLWRKDRGAFVLPACPLPAEWTPVSAGRPRTDLAEEEGWDGQGKKVPLLPRPGPGPLKRSLLPERIGCRHVRLLVPGACDRGQECCPPPDFQSKCAGPGPSRLPPTEGRVGVEEGGQGTERQGDSRLKTGISPNLIYTPAVLTQGALSALPQGTPGNVRRPFGCATAGLGAILRCSG